MAFAQLQSPDHCPKDSFLAGKFRRDHRRLRSEARTSSGLAAESRQALPTFACICRKIFLLPEQRQAACQVQGGFSAVGSSLTPGFAAGCARLCRQYPAGRRGGLGCILHPHPQVGGLQSVQFSTGRGNLKGIKLRRVVRSRGEEMRPAPAAGGGR